MNIHLFLPRNFGIFKIDAHKIDIFFAKFCSWFQNFMNTKNSNLNDFLAILKNVFLKFYNILNEPCLIPVFFSNNSQISPVKVILDNIFIKILLYLLLGQKFIRVFITVLQTLSCVISRLLFALLKSDGADGKSIHH